MTLMYLSKKAFEKVKKFLEVNQYSFECVTAKEKYLIKIKEWGLTTNPIRGIIKPES